MYYQAGAIVRVSDSRSNRIYIARVVESFNEKDGDGTLEPYDEPITIDGNVIDVAEEFPVDLESMAISLWEPAKTSL